jgi:hypothetical protein
MVLHFDFIKACVVILLIMFATSGDYNIITNWKNGSFCKFLDKKIAKDMDTNDFCMKSWVFY